MGRSHASNEDGPQWSGRDAVRGNMQRVFSLIYNGSTVNTTVHHAISQGNMGVIRFTMAAEFPNGAAYENEYTIWVEIRGGEIVKVWEYVDAAWTLAQMQSAGMELPSQELGRVAVPPGPHG